MSDGRGTGCLSGALSNTVWHPAQVTVVSCLLRSSLGSVESGEWAVLGKLEPGKVTNAKETCFLWCKGQDTIWSKYRCDFSGKDKGLREGIRILTQFYRTQASISDQVSVSFLSVRWEDYMFFPRHRVAIRQKTLLNHKLPCKGKYWFLGWLPNFSN